MIYGLSPEAQKAVDESIARSRGFRPTVSISKSRTRVILQRPSSYHGGPAAHGFAAWVETALPWMEFHQKGDFWFAEIERLGDVIAALEASRSSGYNLSRGATAWLKERKG